MSRIGLQPITLPDGVSLVREGRVLTLSGSKGQLFLLLPEGVEVAQKDKSLLVSRVSDERQHRALHGTIRSLLANIVTGITDGFVKKLELVGIGYRAAIEEGELVLLVGFTHPVKMSIPEGLEVKIEKNVITISGIDRQRVGQFAAVIRDVRPPEPYKGKGIRYEGEKVRMKQGKAVKAGS
ncbi:MAG: 50S ribosomal protein L6 [Candidatus Berkelbacteria bacterium]|nr:50S ribosomal protein L6 [Candidatus Berkelbacteria bacterium]MCR4307608.1 50S ribosomal protein L6 [Candidatus Berkelbacteria bacterium]